MHFVGIWLLLLFVGGIPAWIHVLTVVERPGCDTVTCPASSPSPPPTPFLSLYYCTVLFFFFLCYTLTKCLLFEVQMGCFLHFFVCVCGGGGGGHVELGSEFVNGECNSSTLQTALFFKTTQVTSFFNLIFGVARWLQILAEFAAEAVQQASVNPAALLQLSATSDAAAAQVMQALQLCQGLLIPEAALLQALCQVGDTECYLLRSYVGTIFSHFNLLA